MSLAPIIVAAVASSSSFALRCRITGMVSFDACCPGAGDDADKATDAAPQTTISDAGCCDRLVLTSAKPPADEGDRTSVIVPAPTLAVFVAAAAPPAVSVEPRVDSEEGPPGTAPPLYVAKHAFLI